MHYMDMTAPSGNVQEKLGCTCKSSTTSEEIDHIF